MNWYKKSMAIPPDLSKEEHLFITKKYLYPQVLVEPEMWSIPKKSK